MSIVKCEISVAIVRAGDVAVPPTGSRPIGNCDNLHFILKSIVLLWCAANNLFMQAFLFDKAATAFC